MTGTMLRRTFLFAAPLAAQFGGARTEVYKTVGDTKLELFIFSPEGHQPKDRRPAILFFFGGGWTNGTPKQFEPHCRMLAAKGMVAITADYRVTSRHQVKVVDCVRDAKSAVRWVRQNAKRLGIDPKRIAAGGGSAGGHLAAATATLPEFEEPSENIKISSRPNALVLFNPALVLTLSGAALPITRTGVEAKRISPDEHIRKGTPPTIIFHGKADTTVPYATVELFTRKMQAAGNRCELVGFEGQTHGFFNYGRGENKMYEKTTAEMIRFLASLGYLNG